MRKLATLRKIDSIRPIDGADAIEAAVIGGWTVVVKKQEFAAGDIVIFLEIDSWVPHEIAPFLTKAGDEPREYKGVKGERLRTVKLRGQLSQGLLLKPTLFESVMQLLEREGRKAFEADLSEMLGVQKWEPPLDLVKTAFVRGNFPSEIRKTDQERVQNLVREVFETPANQEAEYEITVKLDGSSMTVYRMGDEIGVCSRNQNLKLDQDGNQFVNAARACGILEKLADLRQNIAIQGELMGTGIQGNREGLDEHTFFVFDIWSIDEQRYLAGAERRAICENLGLRHVPVINERVSLKLLGLTDVEKMLAFADGPSLNNKIREGVVFKRCDGGFSFKAISNKFLLKGGN